MALNGLKKAIIICHRNHASRALKTATDMGINAQLPLDLPGGFDRESSQWWTRDIKFWIIHELMAVGYLSSPRFIRKLLKTK